MFVWGLVACTWHKRQVTLKVVQGKVEDPSGDADQKGSWVSSSDSSPPRGEPRVKSTRAKRAHKGTQ